MAKKFLTGFEKTAGKAGFWGDAKKLDHAGLGMLALAPAYHGYKAIKDKDKGSAAVAGTELAGLGLLARAVSKGHK